MVGPVDLHVLRGGRRRRRRPVIDAGLRFQGRTVDPAFEGDGVGVAGVVQVDDPAAVGRDRGGGHDAAAHFALFVGKAGVGLFQVRDRQGRIGGTGQDVGVGKLVVRAVRLHLIVPHVVHGVGVRRPARPEGRIGGRILVPGSGGGACGGIILRAAGGGGGIVIPQEGIPRLRRHRRVRHGAVVGRRHVGSARRRRPVAVQDHFAGFCGPLRLIGHAALPGGGVCRS